MVELQKDIPFLLKAEEPEDHCLSLRLAFPCRAEDADQEETLTAILADATPLCPNEEQYEIRFEHYILYQIRNESYASWGPDETATGDFLKVFEKSHLLETLQLFTDCQICEDGSYYPGKWQHYGIFCQNHIVDVIACQEPAIIRE